MRNITLRCPQFLAVFAVLLITFAPTSNSQAPAPAPQEPPPQFPMFPTGALATFPEESPQPAQKKVFIQREDAVDQRVWVVDSQEVLFTLPSRVGNQSETVHPAKGVGFLVPQLPRGQYTAWYEASARNPGRQSMKFLIIPGLMSETGIVRGAPGTTVKVSVRIGSPTIRRRGSTATERVSVPITLQSNNADIADLASTESASVSTNRGGFAEWTVQIKTKGIAEFTATAADFEPATVMVVGMSKPARTFREGEMLAAREAFEEQSRIMTSADIIRPSIPTERQVEKTAEARSRKDSPPANTGGGIIAGVKRDTSQNAAIQAEIQASNTAAAMTSLSAQFDNQPRSLSEEELQPGDILMVLGSSPISGRIRDAESAAYQEQVPYSHAALYLGKNKNRVGMVAEMWPSGYWITPISVSSKGALVIDVYRRKGIDSGQAGRIAAQAGILYITSTRYTSLTLPMRASLIAYAVEQIGVLASASQGLRGFSLRGLAFAADLRTKGKKQMICSELVAWTYHDAGLGLEIQYWQNLVDSNVLSTLERRMDYTTPNMLAKSNSLTKVGNYLSP